MGEYADYMINGDDCQECGQYIGDGDGIPRSCSDCAQPITHNNKEDFLSIKKAEDLDKLPPFLEEREYNFVKNCKRDRKGQPMIGLGMKSRGSSNEKRGLVVCANDELLTAAVNIVEQYREKANK